MEVHGPVEQGLFLEQMGVRERVEMLVSGIGGGKGGKDHVGERIGGKAGSGDDAGGEGREGGDVEGRKKGIRDAVERLVSRVPGRGMGTLYKVLAIVPERGGKRPVGFGGNIS